jgi:hypothetical protein
MDGAQRYPSSLRKMMGFARAQPIPRSATAKKSRSTRVPSSLKSRNFIRLGSRTKSGRTGQKTCRPNSESACGGTGSTSTHHLSTFARSGVDRAVFPSPTQRQAALPSRRLKPRSGAMQLGAVGFDDTTVSQMVGLTESAIRGLRFRRAKKTRKKKQK